MQLSDVEVRILGCLMEKEATTPDNYRSRRFAPDSLSR